MRKVALAALFSLGAWLVATSCGGPSREPAAATGDSDASIEASLEPTDAGTDRAPDADTPAEDPTKQALEQALREQVDADAGTGDLRLYVIDRGPDLPWVLGIVNLSKQRYRVAADPRLLYFEVRAPGKKGESKCKVPDAVGQAARAYEVTLEPGQAASQMFDPRLYCFASAGQSRLVPGAIITPHFGWPEKKKTRWEKGKRIETANPVQPPPFLGLSMSDEAEKPPSLNEPVERGDAGATEFVKALHAPTFALGSEYAKWSRAGLDPNKPKPEEPFELIMQTGSDAHAQRSATITVTLKNRVKRKLIVYFRRELVSFEVMTANGIVACDPEPDNRAPDPRAFSRMPPGDRITVTSRLMEMCPPGTFARPGLYLVHGRFEASKDGSEHGLDAYTGRVSSDKPVSVRIRTGEPSASPVRRMQLVDLSSTDGKDASVAQGRGK
jgi:hypothetical protein